LIWTAWCNSRHNAPSASYGLRVTSADRASHFEREWNAVVVELPTYGGMLEVEANVAKKSFWDSSCGELISRHIRDWFVLLGLVPWPRGFPPKFTAIQVSKARFRVRLPTDSAAATSPHDPSLKEDAYEQ